MSPQTPLVARFLLGYGEMLVGGLSEEEMDAQPAGGINTPAWILGHLAYAADRHATFVGGEPQLADWADRFGQSSEPPSSLDQRPGKAELIAAWNDATERLLAAFAAASDEQLDAATGGPLAESFPQVRDFLTFSLGSHTAVHLGQLSAWRRAMGKPAMF